MNRFVFTGLLAIALISENVFAQSSGYLARTETYVIEPEEFVNRWELSPQPGRELGSDLSESKRELLYTMVAEKVLAQYAIEQGIDTTFLFRRLMKSLEEIYMRDALFKAEIESRYTVTDSMLAVAEWRSKQVRYVRFIYSSERDEAIRLFARLESGLPFDTLFFSRPERLEQPRSLRMSFGSMEAPIEEIIYSQNTGTFSQPVKRPEGWFIFYLDSIAAAPVLTDKEETARKRKLKDMVTIRQMDKYYQIFMKDFFKGKDIRTDGQLFSMVSNKIADKIIEKTSLNHPNKPAMAGLSDAELLQIMDELGPEYLEKDFIKYAPAPVTLREFLLDLQFRGFGSASTNKQTVINSFGEWVEIMARDAVLNDEARLREYHLLPDIIEKLEEKKANFLADRIKGRVSNTVSLSEEEIKDYYENVYNKEADTVLINVIEIQVATAEKAAQIMDDYRKGVPFEVLQKGYNENEYLRRQEGKTGLFMPSQRGQLGQQIAELSIGDVYGPYRYEKYYSVVQLIEKKIIGFTNKPEPEPYEKIRQELGEQMFDDRFKDKLSDLTARLAIKYQVEINESLLENIPVTSVNMAGFQAMGFGGKILAVPYADPFPEWVKKWQELKKLVP